MPDPSTSGDRDGSGIQCAVCLCMGDATCLDIFDDGSCELQIAAVIAQHLKIELAASQRKQVICEKCWQHLQDFHRFFRMVEEAHEQQPTKIKHEPTPADERYGGQCESQQNTEFVAIKHELADGDAWADEDIAVKCEVTASSDSDEAESVKDGSEDNESEKKGAASARRKIYQGKIKVDKEILDFYKRIVCDICDVERMAKGEPALEYSTVMQLNRHMKSTHNLEKGTLKCPLCEKKIRTRAQLLQHKDMHLNPDKFRCAICAEVHQNVEEHMKNKHRERHYCCELCGKRFPFQQRLKAHMKRLHSSKDEICEHCQKPFTKFTIEEHKRAVHGTSFICEHCPKTFKTRFWLDRHMEEHNEGERNTKVVKCAICDVVVKDKYILMRHMKLMHTEQKPVSCGSCGKMFKSKNNLNAHLKNVCTDRAFPCTICGRQFKKKVKLTEHMTTHTGKALYVCSFCPKTFCFETQFYTHRKQVHHEQWLEMQQRRREGYRFKVNQIIN